MSDPMRGPGSSPSSQPQPFTVSGQVVDCLRRQVKPATILVVDGRIANIRAGGTTGGAFLMPGFVDAHVHVESSLLPPYEFARQAIAHGTVATVSDPHEIANVLGVAGVRFMLDDASDLPFKFHFGAPSCVPATGFDRAGATLGPAAVGELLDDPRIGYLAEMMNYPGVVQDDVEVHAKLAAARERRKPIDGHAPQLTGAALAKYAAAGITTDHECTTLAEAREKIAAGMHILIREGSAARNFDALYSLLFEAPGRCMLCSDDKHPDQLVLGHINQLARRAVESGVPVFDVLQAACVNPVKHYGLNVGLLQVGDPADFIEVDSLTNFHVQRAWLDGQLVAEGGRSLWPRRRSQTLNQFFARHTTPDDFAIRVPVGGRDGAVRVIVALDGQLVTDCEIVRPTIVAEQIVADPERDLLKIALVDRYQQRPAVTGLVKNFGLRTGACASSVAHDSHNIVAVGASDEALARAVNLVIEARGGLAAVGSGVERVLSLPIAGLMSDQPGDVVASGYTELDALVKTLGSPLAAPFMTLSFMALLVIPSLKLGPDGLFDVERFAPVELFV